MTPSAAYIEAAKEVQTWIREHEVVAMLKIEVEK